MPANKTKLQRFFLLPLGLLAVIVMALGSGEQALAEPGMAHPEHVSLCVGMLTGIPFYIAQEQGLFAREGLAVQVKKFRTASEAFDAFFKGECDLAAVTETPVVFKSFERQDFSILASLFTSDNSVKVLASRHSGIRTPYDLKGKRIFVVKGSSTQFFLDIFLARNWLTTKEVHIVHDGVPDVTAAFASRTIDAFCGTDVLIEKPKKVLGAEAVVFDASGLCLLFAHLVAMNSLLSARPEIIKKILVVLLKNEDILNNDRAAAVKAAAAALEIEEQAMDGIWNNYRWNVNLSQVMLLSLEQKAMWMIASGLTSKSRIPNYLNFIYRDALQALKPAAVSLLK